MAYYVYIVECIDGMYYTGITWNLEKRVSEHNAGVKTPLQPSRLPVKLVYWEEFPSKMEAAKREKEIKAWSRIKKEELIKRVNPELLFLNEELFGEWRHCFSAKK